MCIISIFKAQKRSDKATIQRMMNANRDGVGIAWNTGKTVYFKKGFTKAEEVEAFVARLRADEGVRNIVFHARIGTSGGISAEKCHPYPITGDADTLNRTTYSGRVPVVFHNGIFSIDIESGLNDSQTFVKNMLFPLWRADPHGLARGKYDRLIEMAVKGSRLVILYPDGFRAYGNGWQEEDEAWYSNAGYKAYTPARYAWDDDGWDGYGHSYDREWWDDYREWQRDKETRLSFRDWRALKHKAKAGGDA